MVHDGYNRAVSSLPAARPEPTPEPAESEVWSLLGRADVVLRGVLDARDRKERRIWEERARAWLSEVNQAWVRSPR